MGNVHAASAPPPPPPINLTPPVIPKEQSLDNVKLESPRLQNPGTVEEIHKVCKGK